MEMTYEEIDKLNIDEGMREIVYNFNKAGYNTTNSCEGHLSGEGDDFSMICPYITFTIPEDSTMMGFILNNLTVEMHLDAWIPLLCNGDIITTTTLTEDGLQEDFEVNAEKFVENHTPKDFQIGIYMNNVLADSKENFLYFQKLFMDNLLELSRYLIQVNEVYRECC